MTVSNQRYLSIVDVNMNVFASGVYTVKLSGEQISINKKMMIVK
jgi:hypothetical protein